MTTSAIWFLILDRPKRCSPGQVEVRTHIERGHTPVGGVPCSVLHTSPAGSLLISSLFPHTCLVWSQIYPCYCPPCPHYFLPAGSIPRESLNPYCFKNTTTRSKSRQDLLGRYDAQKELKISVASWGPEYQNLEGDTDVNVYQMEAWVWKSRETLCRVQTAFIQQSLSNELAPSHCKFFLLPERIPESSKLLLPLPHKSPPPECS